MKNTIHILLPVIFLFFSGCLAEDRGGSDKPVSGETILFRFTVEQNNVVTKGVPAQEGENQINDMYVFLFDYTTNGTGLFQSYFAIEDEDIPDGDDNEQFSLTIRQTSEFAKSGEYSILVIANGGNLNIEGSRSIEDIVYMLEGMNENDVIRYMVTQISGAGIDETNNEHAIKGNNLLMSGRTAKNNR